MANMLPRVPGWGNVLGTSLGTGIGEGLQALANLKMQQYANDQFIKSFEDQQPVSPQQLAQAPVQQGVPVSPQYTQPTTAKIPSYQDMLVHPSIRALGGLGNMQNIPIPGQPVAQQPVQQQQVAQQQTVPQQVATQPVAQQQKAAPFTRPQIALLARAKDDRQRTDMAAKFLSENEKNALEREKEATKREQFKEKIGIQGKLAKKQRKIKAFETSQAARTKIIEAGSSARDRLVDLKRMETLNREDRLEAPGYVEFLERSGLDVAALYNTDSQEFLKMQAGFLRDAKQYFGARVTDYDIKQFLKTIPTLSQSPAGRSRIIANLKRLEKVKLARSDALKKIVKKGKVPLDFLEQIDTKVEKLSNRYYKEFQDDLAKPTPPSRGTFGTAMSAGLGSIVGAPGKLIGGIGSLLAKLA